MEIYMFNIVPTCCVTDDSRDSGVGTYLYKHLILWSQVLDDYSTIINNNYENMFARLYSRGTVKRASRPPYTSCIMYMT